MLGWLGQAFLLSTLHLCSTRISIADSNVSIPITGRGGLEVRVLWSRSGLDADGACSLLASHWPLFIRSLTPNAYWWVRDRMMMITFLVNIGGIGVLWFWKAHSQSSFCGRAASPCSWPGVDSSQRISVAHWFLGPSPPELLIMSSYMPLHFHNNLSAICIENHLEVLKKQCL